MLKVRCPFCKTITLFRPINVHIIEDGDILWDSCMSCEKEISLDLIITKRDGDNHDV